MVKIVSIAALRPDLIRMSLYLNEMDKQLGKNHIFGVTGQVYSDNLYGIFLEQLGLRQPNFNLKIGSGTYNEMQARILERLPAELEKIKPDAVVILGDNTSAVGLALAVSNMGIPLIHIEGGMRCFDKSVPEERNRPVIDSLANLNLCYHALHRENLVMEGYPADRAIVVGNLITDVVQGFMPYMNRNVLPKGKYFLATIHRNETVTNKSIFEGIIRALRNLKHPVIFPMFPKTMQKLKEFKLWGLVTKNKSNIIPLEPQGYLEMLALMKHAEVVLSDSGSIPEECAILGVPCISVRDCTERQELLDAGTMVLSGRTAQKIIKTVAVKHPPTNPYLSNPTKRTVEAVLNNLELVKTPRTGYVDARKRRSFV